MWDVQKLFSNVVTGIQNAFDIYPEIQSVSIDTWGVDYVLLKEEKNRRLSMPTATAAQRL